MKQSQRALLTIIGAVLFTTSLAISTQAGPMTQVKGPSESHRQSIMNPPDPVNERFSDVKSDGKSAGSAFAFGHGGRPIVFTGFADPGGAPTANPEPTTLLLLATGLVGFGSIVRSRRKPR